MNEKQALELTVQQARELLIESRMKAHKLKLKRVETNLETANLAAQMALLRLEQEE